MGQVNGRGRFSTLHSSETPGPIFMKLEIYNRTRPLVQSFGGYVDVGGLANSQFG